MNVKIIICADGATRLRYGEKEKTVVREEILCDGPTTMLQAGLVNLQHVGDSFWEPED